MPLFITSLVIVLVTGSLAMLAFSAVAARREDSVQKPPVVVDFSGFAQYDDGSGQEEADAEETAEEPDGGSYAVCRIPAGRYARFIIHGDMVQAVGQAWQEIWQMDLPRTFQCDFEEYQDDSMDHAEIHIYVGIKRA